MWVEPRLEYTMTVNDAPVPEDVQCSGAPLELLTDDERVWTAVPVDAVALECGTLGDSNSGRNRVTYTESPGTWM